jgi:phage-related minor tail protein
MSTISALKAILALDNSPYLSSLVESQSAASGFGAKLSNLGGAIVVGALAAAAGAVVGIGAAAWDAGNTVDEAMDTIQIATGATGSKLDILKTAFTATLENVPGDAQAIADTIGILNSRLGDMPVGVLQLLAMNLSEVSRITGTDAKANTELATRAFGDWNIALEDSTKYLDKVFAASQNSGVGFDSLLETVVQYGAPMRNFGFSFEETVALMAKWEKEGVNVETVMGGMRIGAGKFITQGKDMKKGLWETVDAIQAAKTKTEGLTIATKIFGAKAAGDMYDTIKAGKFNIDDLVGSMQNADGAILKTAQSTADWGEKWKLFQNQMTVALAPLGQTMMDSVGSAMDSVTEIFYRPEIQAALNTFVTMIGSFINQAVTYIPVLIDGFFQFITFLQNNQGIVIGILAALGVAALAWGITTAIAAWTAMAPLLPVIAVLVLIGAAAYLLYQAWITNFGGIQQIVASVWAMIQPVLQNLWNWLQVAIPAAIQFLANAWNNVILPALQNFWAFLQANLFPQLSAMAGLIGAVLNVAFTALAGIVQNVIIPAISSLWSWFQEKLWPVIQNVASWLSSKLQPAFSGISDAIGKVIGWITTLTSKLNNIKLPAWMTPGSPTPWENGLRGVSDAMSTLSRTNLPTFNAALNLQTQPIMANGTIDLQPQGSPVSTETATGQNSATDAMMMEDIRRMLQELPNTIVRANRVAFEKITQGRSQ